MIERIYIDNFRCFSNFEFKPGKVNLILGANGSGKSSMFAMVSSLVDVLIRGEPIAEAFATQTLTRWDSRDVQKLELDVVRAEGGTFGYRLEVKHDRDRRTAAILSEVVRLDDRTLFRYEGGSVYLYNNEGKAGTSFAFKGNRSFLADVEDRPESQSLREFLSAVSGMGGLKLIPSEMSASSTHEHATLARNGENFASWYRHLQQEDPEGVARCFDALRLAIPGFRSLRLVKTSQQTRHRDLVAKFAASGSDYEVDFDELSDGQRVLVVLYALLVEIEGGNRTLMIDEPGNYVSLSELQPWLQNLDDALGDTSQLFLISHNPEVIDFTAAESPFFFERADGGPVRVKAAVFDRETGLTASQQIVRGLVDGE